MDEKLYALALAGTLSIERRDGVTCLVIALNDDAPAVPSLAKPRKGHVMRAVLRAAREHDEPNAIIRAAAGSLVPPMRGIRDRRVERCRRAYATLVERGEI